MKNENILIVGCGGIACELIKLLYLNGKKQITLLDYDTISFSNLNRQFMFTKKDVGLYKCKTMAEKYISKILSCNALNNSFCDSTNVKRKKYNSNNEKNLYLESYHENENIEVVDINNTIKSKGYNKEYIESYKKMSIVNNSSINDVATKCFEHTSISHESKSLQSSQKNTSKIKNTKKIKNKSNTRYTLEVLKKESHKTNIKENKYGFFIFNGDCFIRALICDIKSKDLLFFSEFDVIFNCLDNLEARLYVNMMIVFLKKSLFYEYCFLENNDCEFLEVNKNKISNYVNTKRLLKLKKEDIHFDSHKKHENLYDIQKTINKSSESSQKKSGEETSSCMAKKRTTITNYDSRSLIEEKVISHSTFLLQDQENLSNIEGEEKSEDFKQSEKSTEINATTHQNDTVVFKENTISSDENFNSFNDLIFVDGGSTGFFGQSWLYSANKECYNCISHNMKSEIVPVCTIRTLPVKFENCIHWAQVIFFEQINTFKHRVFSSNDAAAIKRHQKLCKSLYFIFTQFPIPDKNTDLIFSNTNISQNLGFADFFLKSSKFYGIDDSYFIDEEPSSAIQKNNLEGIQVDKIFRGIKRDIETDDFILHQSKTYVEKKPDLIYPNDSFKKDMRSHSTQNLNILTTDDLLFPNSKILYERINEDNSSQANLIPASDQKLGESSHIEYMLETNKIYQLSLTSGLPRIIINLKECRALLKKISIKSYHNDMELSLQNMAIELSQNLYNTIACLCIVLTSFFSLIAHPSVKTELIISCLDFCSLLKCIFFYLGCEKNLILDKDDDLSLETMYLASKFRAHVFNISPKNRLESETISAKIIPAVCTTNSLVASLMYLSYSTQIFQNRSFNYYLTRNQKLAYKTFLADQNTGCNTCTKDMFILQSSVKMPLMISAERLYNLLLKILEFDFAIDELTIVKIDRVIFEFETLEDAKKCLDIQHNDIIDVNISSMALRIYFLPFFDGSIKF